MNATFSNRLKQIRTRRNLRVSQVALALGISPSTYREWEYGRKISGHENYIKLATIFGVSLEELLRGETRKETEKDELAKTLSKLKTF